MVRITAQKHARWSQKARVGRGYAARFTHVPVVPDELNSVAASLPILFTGPPESSDPETAHDLAAGGDFPVAILAPQGDSAEDICALSPQGHWLAGYVPALLRLYPFSCDLASAPVSQDDAEAELPGFLRLDPDSPSLGDFSDGARLFDVTGHPQDHFAEVIRALGACHRALTLSRLQVVALRKARLLQPAHSLPAFEASAFDGLYVVDRAALAQLPARKLLPLFTSGALALAYAHLISLEQVARLRHLRHQLAHAPVADPATAADPKAAGQDFLSAVAGALQEDQNADYAFTKETKWDV